MREQNAPEYALIRAAVAGEKWAIEKVVAYYQGEIDKEGHREKAPAGRELERGNRRGFAPADHHEA